MIWLWTPGFNPDRSIAEPPVDLTNMENDMNVSRTSPRTHIILRNPDYIDEIAKDLKIIVKKAMNGRVRTYTVRDRADFAAYRLTLTFQNLREERRQALEHFLLSSDGLYVGYKSPDDKMNVALIESPDTTFVAQARAAGIDNDKHPIEDQINTTQISLLIMRTVTGG